MKAPAPPPAPPAMSPLQQLLRSSHSMRASPLLLRAGGTRRRPCPTARGWCRARPFATAIGRRTPALTAAAMTQRPVQLHSAVAGWRSLGARRAGVPALPQPFRAKHRQRAPRQLHQAAPTPPQPAVGQPRSQHSLRAGTGTHPRTGTGTHPGSVRMCSLPRRVRLQSGSLARLRLLLGGGMALWHLALRRLWLMPAKGRDAAAR